MGIQKRGIKGYSHSFRITSDMRAVSLLESREQRYKKLSLIIVSPREPIWPSGKAVG